MPRLRRGNVGDDLMGWWQPLAVLSFAVGLAVLLAGWSGFPWWKARREIRGVDVEWALLTDEFGEDGLWLS